MLDLLELCWDLLSEKPCGVLKKNFIIIIIYLGVLLLLGFFLVFIFLVVCLGVFVWVFFGSDGDV